MYMLLNGWDTLFLTTKSSKDKVLLKKWIQKVELKSVHFKSNIKGQYMVKYPLKRPIWNVQTVISGMIQFSAVRKLIVNNGCGLWWII